MIMKWTVHIADILVAIHISIINHFVSGNCEGDTKQKAKLSKPESCSTIPTARTGKCIKNTSCIDPEPKLSNSKKGCAELDDEFGSEGEVWLLQCPKNFDPNKMICAVLGKNGRQSCKDQPTECRADRFSGKTTLAVISPEKVAEYQLLCDKMKLVGGLTSFNDSDFEPIQCPSR